MSRYRLLTIAAGVSLLLGGGGWAREVARFGRDDTSGLQHLEREVTRRVNDQARALEVLAQRVARDVDLVAAAAASRDRLPELFARLSALAGDGSGPNSATVWVPSGPAGGYRVLAWSDGPAEELSPVELASAPTLRVAPGVGGLRLVFVQSIQSGGRRLGVAAAETVLAQPSQGAAFAPVFVLPTSVGAIRVLPLTPSGESAREPGHFTVPGRDGQPLIEAHVDPAQISDARRALRWRVAGLASVPLALWLLWIARGLLDRRRATRIREWFAWSLAGSGVIAAVAALLVWLGPAAGVAHPWMHAAQAVAALTLAAALPASAWWIRWRRRSMRRAPVRFLLEHLLGGLSIASGLVVMAWLWRDRINPTSLEKWQLPILAGDAASIAELTGVLLAQTAVSWAVAGVLGALAARWQVTWRRPAGWIAAVIWTVPPLAVSAAPSVPIPLPWPGAAAVALSAAAFGLSALWIRHHYRATSEARRLVFRFGALVVPVIVAYPLAAASADRATRDVIEREYGPATMSAQQPEALMAVLSQAQDEIDRVPRLASLLTPRGAAAVSSRAAFGAWTQTRLSRDRITSEIELYGQDRRLVSRFSLNVPEFGALYQPLDDAWQGDGCGWVAFAEVKRFGAEERRMLHAERAVCDPEGRFLGAVVLHVIPDYRALPFVSSASPYYDVLGASPARAGSRIGELQVVVYGWGLQPVFTSGRVAWPIDAEIDQRLYQSREPFWQERDAGGRRFRIHFTNDRAGVYALGYPAPTPQQHVTRIAEATAVLAAAFIAYLLAAAVASPLLRRTPTGLPKLFREIRASFYRKLFLFFVLAAVGPVLLFAIAFGAYMTAKLRADVETEAGNVALVARRVFDELSAAQARPGQAPIGPNDDVMVWIRQVVDQDVNLYEGPLLTATSQRDLFEAGLLPARTPAAVFREVVLRRHPVVVAEDRLGALRYLVAAVPVPALRGRDAVLTVPLAPRQREIEREIDDLTRGVLAGAVVLVLFAAALGASVAARVSDPVARLTRATRLIAAGRLDVRLVADSADELGRLVDDFNAMTKMLVAQRAELARANQLKAWAEMSRQVAHEIKNPLTPIQLAAEHLQRVHEDQQRPLGPVFDQCVTTILKQVRLLRQIASEFSTFASQPTPRFADVQVTELLHSVVEPYRLGLPAKTVIDVQTAAGLPAIRTDRTLISRALTNLVENALQAMPGGGSLRLAASATSDGIVIEVTDTGVGMDEEGVRRAFEPYFSTKTAGSGLGLANAKRNVEHCGGVVSLTSRVGQGTTVTVVLPADPHAAHAIG